MAGAIVRGPYTRPMFADSAVARRIEAAEARLTHGVGSAVASRDPARAVLVAEIGAGAAVHAGQDSPFDKVIGLGFGPLDLDAFARFEEQVLARGGSVRVELATLADSEVGALLTERGYVLRGFENVLGLRLDRAVAARFEADLPDGIEVARAVEGETDEWIRVLNRGFSVPDVFDGPPPTESFDSTALEQVFRDMQLVPGFTRYLARRGGAIAGGASVRLDAGVAQLAGAATLPEHRRRGVQTALLRARLADAARAGCDLAVVTTQPGSVSQQNVTREGFALLYARAILVRV